jgi:hypothetical protein
MSTFLFLKRLWIVILVAGQPQVISSVTLNFCRLFSPARVNFLTKPKLHHGEDGLDMGISHFIKSRILFQYASS